MPPRRSSRSTRPREGGSQNCPRPKQRAGPGRTKGRTRRARSKASEAQSSVDDGSDDGARDLIDLIDSSAAQHGSTEQEFTVEEAHRGASDSDDDRYSISSGPYIPHEATPKSPRPSTAMCSGCLKLHQKAKRMKRPMKDKLLDNDPESLTCDQWVLNKTWRPRRNPNIHGRLLKHVQLIKRRLASHEATSEERRPPGCCRPHIFLQRTLQRMMRTSGKREMKKKGRKRSRNDYQIPLVAKQQRLSSSSSSSSRNEPHDGDHPSPGSAHHSRPDPLQYQGEVHSDDPEDTHLTIELIPCGVTMEKPTKSVKVQPKKKAAKNSSEFRDLLAQMRGNSSVIIKEQH